MRNQWSELDGLRGLAILMVMLVHFWAHAVPSGNGFPVSMILGDLTVSITWIFATASVGVRIFFVLSGFLLFRHWLDDDEDERRFAPKAVRFIDRRARRILPAYALFMAIYLALCATIGPYRYAASLDPVSAVSNFFFLSPIARWLQPFGQSVNSLDVIPGTWSLNPEIWFYALMPFVAWAVTRAPRAVAPAVLALFLAMGPAYRLSLGPDAHFADMMNILGSIDSFAWGMAAALLSKGLGPTKFDPWLTILGLAIFAFAWSPAGAGFRLVDYYFDLAFGMALALVGLSGRPLFAGAFFRSQTLIFVGRISYSVFLCHVMIAWYVCAPLADLIGASDAASRFAVNIFVGGSISLLIGHVTYHALERPWMIGRTTMNIQSVAVVALLLVAVPTATFLFLPALQTFTAENYRTAGIALATGHARSAGMLPQFEYTDVSGSRIGEVPTDGEHETHGFVAKADIAGQISVAGQLDASTNKWIAVYLPIRAGSGITMGSHLRVRATIVVDEPSDGTICVGIFDGNRDVCSESLSLQGRHDLSVETVIRDPAKFHAKLNLTPGAGSSAVAFRVVSFAVETR